MDTCDECQEKGELRNDGDDSWHPDGKKYHGYIDI